MAFRLECWFLLLGERRDNQITVDCRRRRRRRRRRPLRSVKRKNDPWDVFRSEKLATIYLGERSRE